MRVLFLHYGEFHVNSVIQAFHLGEEMTAAGIEVALCGKGPPERIETVGEPSFECVDYEGLEGLLGRWKRESEDTVICAWTPRELVRKATERATEILDAPYVVHLEDNEEHLLSGALRLPYGELARLPPARLDRICTDDFIHPSHYPRLLERAAAVTGITEELNEFNFGDRPYRIARAGRRSRALQAGPRACGFAWRSSAWPPTTSSSSITASGISRTNTNCSASMSL